MFTINLLRTQHRRSIDSKYDTEVGSGIHKTCQRYYFFCVILFSMMFCMFCIALLLIHFVMVILFTEIVFEFLDHLCNSDIIFFHEVTGSSSVQDFCNHIKLKLLEQESVALAHLDSNLYFTLSSQDEPQPPLSPVRYRPYNSQPFIKGEDKYRRGRTYVKIF